MVFAYCKRCHLPIPAGASSVLCEKCAWRDVEDAVADMSAKHLRDLAEIYGGPPVFCLITNPKGTQTVRQLRAFRDHDRLYFRSVVTVDGITTSGPMYRVPDGWESSRVVRAMRDRRLYLLTNGLNSTNC